MISCPAVNPCRPPLFKRQVSVQTVKLSSTELAEAPNALPAGVFFPSAVSTHEVGKRKSFGVCDTRTKIWENYFIINLFSTSALMGRINRSGITYSKRLGV